MPLFFQHSVNNDTKLAIWKIEEDESFFLSYVPLQRAITHPHKRLQHLAGRYLLQYLFPDFPISLIQIADTRKPYLEDELFHFSISHCTDYAAVIVSKTKRVGVDIEVVSEKIKKIAHKFVSEGEQVLLSEAIQKPGHSLSAHHQLTLLWSSKEAVFKWYGLGNVDFKMHMQLQQLLPANPYVFKNTMLFKKNEDHFIDLHTNFFGKLCLSYIVT